MKKGFAVFIFTLGITTSVWADITGTDSVQATFNTTIVPGTCSAVIQNSAGAVVTTLDIGDVFKEELNDKSKITPFSIVLSNCSGVTRVNITTSGGTCAVAGFTNSQDQGASKNAAVEFWHNQPDTGTQFACSTPATGQNVDISSMNLSVPMNARMIVAASKQVSDVVAGNFIASLNFVLTYQ
ncbi:fimbrial protein [Obesumbacterium proteus]|uniref:fimbrial protein n=1 Tax=Obesumbacterium proteus TaxID=82983 RepID=UPI001033C574|nr:fimbrial protein [Obesumbacterium proteus]TBL78900.1 fimbrial protein [Obesumbacterium proteus]